MPAEYDYLWRAHRMTRDGQPLSRHAGLGDHCGLCGAEDANHNQLSWVNQDWRCEECG
jgi:hypothetical protein